MNAELNQMTTARDAAKFLGLLTVREWLAKYVKCDALPGLVGDFTLDGGRGFVRDEPPRMCVNADGSFFSYCGMGTVVLGLPGPVSVCERYKGHSVRWYAFNRAGAFYFTTEDGKLSFAEAG